MALVDITCDRCGASGSKQAGVVNRSRRNGAPIYCSRACHYEMRRKADKAPSWHERRFEERAETVRQDCTECAKPMWLPPSKLSMYPRCGPDCSKTWRERQKSQVVIDNKSQLLIRPCETCGKQFRPRPNLVRNGGGRFCSLACNTPGRVAITSPEVLALAQQRRREAIAAGLIVPKTGPDHPSWKGGKEAAAARSRANGKGAEQIRRYRSKNPHKVREFAQRRKGRKLGRLEYGSIPRIGNMQRWKCAICRVSIKSAYHVDHITPLAKGGVHAARNVQLLCQTCNVRKSAKDPILYMRELGRLL